MLHCFCYFLFLGCFFCFSSVYSAPHPGTSSSMLISYKKGWFISPKGFTLHASGSSWVQLVPPEENHEVVTLFVSDDDKNQEGRLTVRLDQLQEEEITLKRYVARWIKGYSNYGLKILGSKFFKHDGNSGFMIDLVNELQEKKLRQVVFLKNNNAVIFTCVDQNNNFLKSLKQCNKIVKSFSWSKTKADAKLESAVK